MQNNDIPKFLRLDKALFEIEKETSYVLKNEANFLEEFGFKSVIEVLDVYFSNEAIKLSLGLDCGRQAVTSILLTDYKKWKLKMIENLG